MKLILATGLAVLGGGIFGQIIAATPHAFSTRALAVAISEKTHYRVGDRQSISINGVPALAEYRGVQELPEADSYALVFHVRKW
jgi:hypothetical protein